MDLIEESTSLNKPHSTGSGGSGGSGGGGGGRFRHSGQSGKSDTSRILHPEHHRRLDSVRLSCWCYLSWILLIITSSLIPVYEWYCIDEPDCWSSRYGQIMVSIFFALMTTAVGSVLFLLNCLVRVNASSWRLNFCTMVFVVLIVISIVNFLTGIYLFSLTTCYFDQLTPIERLRSVFASSQQTPNILPNTITAAASASASDLTNASDTDDLNDRDGDGGSNAGTVFEMISTAFNWLHMIALKYDLKIVGIFHLISCLTSFGTGMGFAIIKNNFKYVRQIDFD